MWYQKIDYFVLGLGFMRSKSNDHVYYKHDGGNFHVITLNVYDTLLFGNNTDVIFYLKSNILSQIF
jgi:hypothetical protein